MKLYKKPILYNTANLIFNASLRRSKRRSYRL